MQGCRYRTYGVSALYVVGFLLFIVNWGAGTHTPDTFFPALADTQVRTVILAYGCLTTVANKLSLPSSCRQPGGIGGRHYLWERKSDLFQESREVDWCRYDPFPGTPRGGGETPNELSDGVETAINFHHARVWS